MERLGNTKRVSLQQQQQQVTQSQQRQYCGGAQRAHRDYLKSQKGPKYAARIAQFLSDFLTVFT